MGYEDATHEAAALLLQARASFKPLAALPDSCMPKTAAAAYAIQRVIMSELGVIGGWKVGAAGPDAAPNCAPMPAAGIHRAPARLYPTHFKMPFLESEIAFLLASDLPARERSYSLDEVTAAIASCHPAIEVVQSRFADPDSAGPLAILADLSRHGAFIWGQPIDCWQALDFSTLRVTQTIETGPTCTGIGNPAGDMMRLLLWLANVGAQWAGGLLAGQFVTCGSWTGMTPFSPGTSAVTEFAGGEPVLLRLVGE